MIELPPYTLEDDGIVYPDSDGQPLAEDTRQFRYIMTIQGGIDALFADDEGVFVAGNLLWYPVKGDARLRRAPDVLVAFGRPKGDRRSYRQWLEGDIAPQVVFEVLSYSNTPAEMDQKFDFYQQYGVEEYYVYDPAEGLLFGWQRQGDQFAPILPVEGWVSPRLGLRFELEGFDMLLYRPDGEPLLSYVALQRRERLRWQQAEQERQQAEQERQQAEQERQRVHRLEAQLRTLGVEPDTEENSAV